MDSAHVIATPLASRPGIRHAFLTRRGGVSTGIYAGLNCGLGSSDNPDHVRENRTRAARMIDVSPDRLRTLYQVHSARVVDADGTWPAQPAEADALVCSTPETAIGVLAADCAPVLFADPDARVIGAAHAGWRGALDGVVDATVDAMVARGARRDRITAVVGPCIGPDSYEVGPEFPAPFLAQDTANRSFFIENPGSDRLHFNLPGYVRHRLTESGIRDAHVTGQDTYGDENLFSYRRSCHRSEPDYGRNLSLIALTADD